MNEGGGEIGEEINGICVKRSQCMFACSSLNKWVLESENRRECDRKE